VKFAVSKEALEHGRRAMAGNDHARLDAMTEDEITANALSDPENPPLTDEQLVELERLATEARSRPAAKGVAAE
jgi:hypothetical protein